MSRWNRQLSFSRAKPVRLALAASVCSATASLASAQANPNGPTVAEPIPATTESHLTQQIKIPEGVLPQGPLVVITADSDGKAGNPDFGAEALIADGANETALVGPNQPSQIQLESANSETEAALNVLQVNESRALGDAAATDGLSEAEESSTAFRPGGAAQVAIALGGVIALAIVLKFVIVRLAAGRNGLAARLGPAGRAPSGVMEVLARYPVARGTTLVLLKVDRRVLVLCQTSEGFVTLSEIVDPDDVASILIKTRDDEESSLASRFSALLRRVERSTFDESEEEQLRFDAGATVRARLTRRLESVEAESNPESSATDPQANLKQRISGLRGLVV